MRQPRPAIRISKRNLSLTRFAPTVVSVILGERTRLSTTEIRIHSRPLGIVCCAVSFASRWNVLSGLVGYGQLPEAWRSEIGRDCSGVELTPPPPPSAPPSPLPPVPLDAAGQPLVNKVSGCAPNGPQGG